MKKQHTKLPWKIFEHEAHERDEVGRYVISEDNTLIADLYADFPDVYLRCPLHKEFRANGNLIVRACNHHDELMDFVETVAMGNTEIDRLEEIAKKIIKKVKG